jgi:hypothetical protein
MSPFMSRQLMARRLNRRRQTHYVAVERIGDNDRNVGYVEPINNTIYAHRHYAASGR